MLAGAPSPVDLVTKRLPVLIVMRGAEIGRRYLLNEGSLVLGRRDSAATLVIPGDPAVSGAHCRIDYDAAHQAYTVHDLGSTNGTRLNGEPAIGGELHDGDKLFLGNTILKFTFHDVVEADFHREVDRMMNVDELTGLAVLRVFQEHLRRALHECTPRHRPLAVLMMDLDGLKRINDTHGHHIGAATIATVGRRIGRCVGEAGEATRFGGDEFTAFALDSDRGRGVELGEAVRAALAAEPVIVDGVEVRPTISIGVAAFPRDGATLEQLTRCADGALYRAKAAGRNCVRT